ncbi:ABC transporter substrate-binding protein [Pseudomonas putida]|uniref:ABC transporter substrate-binding protein n=1 Tax=Pseudomonas putida TaxID=303 RepID=UPI00300ECF42
MTRRILAGCIALMAITLFSNVQARPLAEIEKSGQLIIGTYGNFKPFTYFEDGKFVGFEVDIGNEIAKRLKLEPQWKPMEFDSLLTGLSQDRWDMVTASFGITDERSKAVLFTSPHYCTGGAIVTTNPEIKTAQDLNGKKVSVQTGSTYFMALQKVPGVQVRNMSSDNARNALLSGKVDAWVTDKFVAVMMQQKAATSNGSVRPVYIGDMLFNERIATAVQKDNTAFAERYNQVLEDMLKDGTYETISKKWFNEDVRCK